MELVVLELTNFCTVAPIITMVLNICTMVKNKFEFFFGAREKNLAPKI
jgi:hypothetical protein